MQTTLVLIYRYVQTSVDTALYYNDPEFASPGFMLAGDDLPKPPTPPATKKQEQMKGILTKICNVKASLCSFSLSLCCMLLTMRVLVSF